MYFPLKSILKITLIMSLIFPTIANSQNEQKKKSNKIVTDMDADLKGYPDYYKKRVLAFRGIMRKQKTKEAKIDRAVRILKDEESPYRKDALQFLGEVGAKNTVKVIIEAAEDKELRSDAAFALGEIRDKNSINFLLRCLYDESESVRGNAVMALRKITNKQFGYDYSALERERKRKASLWERWWNSNQKTFEVGKTTDEERLDAEKKWEKYGKKYIERVLNE